MSGRQGSDYSKIQQQMNMIISASKYARHTSSQELNTSNDLKRRTMRDEDDMDDTDDQEETVELRRKPGRKLQ
eukprot:m.254464 g.254464  ORF g.254464 m.254464 type:complete len:73 (-) comp18093_c0_seq1:1398-1616(-)